jgi:serine/threonine protein kinase
MVGKTVSHYRIISQLGAGGMGVVYAAEDPRLNRQVALKFVPDDLAHDPHTLARLRSEARTASGLNHPNICTIYDIGEYEGRPFIVMELLKGQTLREHMEAGRLKIQEAVEIGIQASDGLFWAHSKDVIHRDIKPANLFLCDQGPVKILDFGLAKSITPQPALEATLAPTVDLTAVGVAVGTVAYMSPEQVSGDRLDRRTDLFSLGVVLYECVTGQQPFQGKTSAVILASILTQQPKPPIELNSSIPAGLQDVIQACLEKDRELRYQDAGSLRADLKRVKRDLDSGALKVSHTGTTSITSSIRTAQDNISTRQVPVQPPSGTTVTAAVVPVRKNRGLVIGLGIAAAALLIALVGVTMFRASPTTTQPAQNAASTPPQAPAPPVAEPSAQPAAQPADTADSIRRREQAGRFDQAILDADRYLATGDADAANRELGVARAIDPGSPAVADLSARLVEHFRAAANSRRPAPEPARPTPPASRPAAADAPAPRPAQPPPPAVAVIPAPPPPPATSTPPPDSSAISRPANGADTARPPAPDVPVVSTPPPAARPEPAERRAATPPPTPAPAPPTTPVEDDDAAIRRLVATYARAIETKDLALYRTVKPNLSAAEQRTIEDGFRAVTSQRVTITIQSIERRPQDALVRLRRQDVIQVSGRQQTTDNQQTMRLVRTATGWVIREIGR